MSSQLPTEQVSKLQGIIKSMGNDVDFPNAKRYLIKAISATTTGNDRTYSAQELYEAARGMAYRHVDINHDKISKKLPEPQNQTIGARFETEENAVYTLVRIADPTVQRMLDDGRIQKASIEMRYSCDPMAMETCKVEHLYFTGLGLLTNDVAPGDKNTQIYGIESVEGQSTTLDKPVPLKELGALIKKAQERTPGVPESSGNESSSSSVATQASEPASATTGPASQGTAATATATVTTTTTASSATDHSVAAGAANPATATTTTAAAPAAADGKESCGCKHSGNGVQTGSTAGVETLNYSLSAQENQNMSTSTSLNATNASSATTTSPAPAAAGAAQQQSLADQVPKTIPDGKGSSAPAQTGSEAARYDRIAKIMRSGQNFGGMSASEPGEEAVTADGNPNAIGKIWLPDMINLPVGLFANLRNTCRIEMIDRGADTAYFFTISIPEFTERVLSTTENTEESDSTHTITRIPATVKVKTSKNTVSYEAIQFIKGNVIQAVEQGFQEAAVISEDEEVLVALDAESNSSFAKTIYGDPAAGHTLESQVASTETFTEDRLLEAITEIQAQKHLAVNLCCVVHPRQAGALIKRQSYKDASQSGDNGMFSRSGIFDMKYGIELRVSTKVSTGTGVSSATTYRAYVYKKNYSVGMAISKELDTEMLKTFKMSWILRAFHYIVAKVLVNKSIVKVISA